MAAGEPCGSTWPRSSSHSQAEVRGTLAICETMSRTPPDVPASKSRQLPVSNIRQKLPRRPSAIPGGSGRGAVLAIPGRRSAPGLASQALLVTRASGVTSEHRSPMPRHCLTWTSPFMDAISGADSSPFPVGLLPVFEDFGERQHGCNGTGAHSAVPKSLSHKPSSRSKAGALNW